MHAVLTGLDAQAGAAYLAAARELGLLGAPEPEPAGRVDPATWREERVRVGNMSCPSCAWVLERVLAAQEGVRAAGFDFLTGTGRIAYDLRCTSLDRLAAVVRPLGYRLDVARPQTQANAPRIAFILCAVLAMNLMCLSAVRYSRELGWIDSMPDWVPWVELSLCLPVMLVGLGPIAARAWQAVRRGRLTMHALITLSAGTAFVLSCVALATGRPDIYFETAAGLVTIALLSQTLESGLRQRALAETAVLMSLPVARVRLADTVSGREVYVPLEDVRAGQRLRLRVGELVPVDGEALGPCRISEAVLNGEPTPVRRGPGDQVLAGATVVEGEFELRVLRIFADTRLCQIAAGVRQALHTREGALRSADRIAMWALPAVVAVALGAWLGRWALHGLDYALSAAGWFPSVAVLAVACPCAFSLAGASAIVAATSALLRRGILVREPAQLEDLHRTTRVVFDKTRTLTRGELVVTGVAWRDLPRAEWWPLLLAAEADVNHPVAQAVRRHGRELGASPRAGLATPLEEAGRGRVLVTPEGRFVVGAASLFPQRFVVPEVAAGETLVWFGFNGQADGCLRFADGPRTDAAAAVRGIRSAGLGVEILSGDRQAVCDELARGLGAEGARGDVSLDDKTAHVRTLQAQGEYVAYVGDGINDALAMAQAHTSIAVAGSTDEALAAAGFVLLHGKLESLPALFAMGRRLARVVRGNYFWALAFNGCFVPIAAAGHLSPLAAMLLMLASSSAVLLNSLRLRGA